MTAGERTERMPKKIQGDTVIDIKSIEPGQKKKFILNTKGFGIDDFEDPEFECTFVDDIYSGYFRCRCSYRGKRWWLHVNIRVTSGGYGNWCDLLVCPKCENQILYIVD